MMFFGYLLGSLVSICLTVNYQLKKGNSLKGTVDLIVFIMAILSWLPALIIAGAWIRHFVLTIKLRKIVTQSD